MNPPAAVRSAQPSTFSLAAYEIHGSVFSGRAENMSQRTPYTSLHSHQLTQNTFASQLTMAVGDVSHGSCCPTSILHLPRFFWAEHHMFFCDAVWWCNCTALMSFSWSVSSSSTWFSVKSELINKRLNMQIDSADVHEHVNFLVVCITSILQRGH